MRCPYRAVTYLGCFGGESIKPLQVWSSLKGCMALQRRKPKERKGNLATAQNERVRRNRLASKCNQSYSDDFGIAVTKQMRAGLLDPSDCTFADVDNSDDDTQQLA